MFRPREWEQQIILYSESRTQVAALRHGVLIRRVWNLHIYKRQILPATKVHAGRQMKYTFFKTATKSCAM